MRVPVKDVPHLGEFDREIDPCPEKHFLREDVQEFSKRPPHTRSSQQTAETVQRLHEENEKSVAGFRWNAQEELAVLRLGKPIHCDRFLKMLRQLIPARYAGIARNGFLALEVWDRREDGTMGWRGVGGAQPGLVPEYSTMYFDGHGLPTSEMFRGWRTVLLRLIIFGHVSEDGVNRVFGKAEGPESWRYNQQLYQFRNRQEV